MECAITNLTNEIHEFLDLEKYCFTLGILIDLSKTFDTVDNKILLKNSSYMILEAPAMPCSATIFHTRSTPSMKLTLSR